MKARASQQIAVLMAHENSNLSSRHCLVMSAFRVENQNAQNGFEWEHFMSVKALLPAFFSIYLFR